MPDGNIVHTTIVTYIKILKLFRGYYTAVFISTHISRSSVDYQPEAKAKGWWRPRPWY